MPASATSSTCAYPAPARISLRVPTPSLQMWVPTTHAG